MDKTKIRLNLPCKICKEIIYIGDGTIIGNRALHFDSFECEQQAYKTNNKENVNEIYMWRLNKKMVNAVRKLDGQLKGNY